MWLSLQHVSTLTHFLAFAVIYFECYTAISVRWHLVDGCFLVKIRWQLKGMKRLRCSLENLGGKNGRHYNMAMQNSYSIISLFHALGLFLYKKLLVAQPLFRSCTLTENLEQATASFKMWHCSEISQVIYQVLTKVKYCTQKKLISP